MQRAGLPELTAFAAIAELKSFRAAAGRLGVSPSALSHTMRNLEARLGLRLLNRTTRSVALTAVGEQLLRRILPALSDLDSAVTEVVSASVRPSGSVRISAAESGARPIIREVLPDFLAAYPDIHVEFVVDTRFVDIVADGFDAGIRVHEDVPRDMIAVPFGPPIRFAAVASPDYLARHGTPQAPHDLHAHRCIRYRFASGALYHWNMERNGEAAVMDVHGPMTLGNTTLMLEAALAGIGIAWIPDYHTQAPVQAGHLVHLLPEWSPRLGGLCFYYPANRHPPLALKLFMEAVREWEHRRRGDEASQPPVS
ncbi:LysR family transcriptional regulator [Pseudomonas sp. M47T1]|uniref:LysR family transcriptional regulator n=1 Tax=Pseudomonas sp. M47T1 TaxID=1179778 RepID=UPI0002607024|nr:LysR family transcriptional regulator [Pseudomonas sp. M47T1]EIK94293.1 LysR family transcriptional regulator [Pseudomonas sp. M47T1]